MFTGIIQDVGNIVDIAPKLTIQSSLGQEIKEGSSVSVSGVCLTLARKDGTTLFFDVMPETLRKTTLADKTIGAIVNLESSLRIGDELGGHFVYGHVDGVAEVVAIGKQDNAVLLSVRLPAELLSNIAPQGSIAIDGVSLTVAGIDNDIIRVSLVDFTQKHTTLAELGVGDAVNVETDMLAKYVRAHVRV